MSSDSFRVRGDSVVVFFVLTVAITWGIAALLVLFPQQVAELLGEISIFHPLFILGVWSPTISAVVLTVAVRGWAGLRPLAAGLVKWKVGFKWYALVLLGVPLAAWIIRLAAGSEAALDATSPAELLPLLVILMVTGPLGEELGWRGFALPRLLQRGRPLYAALILGAVWGFWHLPAFFVSGLPQDGASIPAFLFMSLCLSVLATWIYLRTEQSILIVILFHYMVNFGLNVIGAPLAASSLASLAAAIAVVTLDKSIGWLRGSEPEESQMEAAFTS